MTHTSEILEKILEKALDNVSTRRLQSFAVKRKTLQASDVAELLKKKQGERSLRQYASDLGISAAYLSDIYRGNRFPGNKILAQLGLVKTIPDPIYESV